MSSRYALDMPDARPLTATSFAILGLLALRPWPTYELAKQVRRSLSHFWPRAESNLYAEAKRLVTGGYAIARVEPTGERQRTVYTITNRGRKALRAWLGEAGGELRLECEPLLKVFFADHGTKAELLETIRAMGAAAEEQQADLRRMAQEYRDGAGPFPERLAVSVLALGLVWEQLRSTIDWSRRACEAVEDWRAPGPGEAPSWPGDIFSASAAPSRERSGSRRAEGRPKRKAR